MAEETFYENDFDNSIGISIKDLMEYYRSLCEQ